MEKSPLIKIKSFFFSLFAGLDRQLGLILLSLAAVGFFTFLSSSQNTPAQISDELRNLALSFVVMWIDSRLVAPPEHRQWQVGEDIGDGFDGLFKIVIDADKFIAQFIAKFRSESVV